MALGKTRRKYKGTWIEGNPLWNCLLIVRIKWYKTQVNIFTGTTDPFFPPLFDSETHSDRKACPTLINWGERGASVHHVLCDTTANSSEQTLKRLLSPWSMDCQERYLQKFFIPFLSCQYKLHLTVAAQGISGGKRGGGGEEAAPYSLFILKFG